MVQTMVRQLRLCSLWRSMVEHRQLKEIIISQHGIIKGKPCLTNLINFYSEMTGLMDKRKAVDIVYQMSLRILVEKLMKCGMEDQLMEQWLYSCT
ncbi:hypothetical protein WISP_76353 [Willisornis vidua]|uniref:Uncharacterized protein n=1 Tax=Willisornis vidua TaxID=1566151 RepID=A0ABQ9D626_9PASS|nr:hypothetical protein WISP_76353 [Willisornis vidua]